MSTKKPLLWLFLIIFLLASCASQAEMEMAAGAPAYDTASSVDDSFYGAESEEGFYDQSTSNSAAASSLPQGEIQERLIIRNGNLSIVVEDTEAALASISELASSSSGWVVSSNLYQYSGNAKTGEVTIRIPASDFSRIVSQIKEMALEVTSESSSGQDVTDEYVDLSSRLGNLEATAARVRNFLDETRNVEEALAVNVELSRLEGDIEVIKGRMQFLEQSAAFSTLTVHITPDVLSQPIEVAGWRPQGVAKEAIEALIATLQGLANFLIWFVIYLLPVLLLLGVPVWLAVRAVRRRRQRKQAAAQTSE